MIFFALKIQIIEKIILFHLQKYVIGPKRLQIPQNASSVHIKLLSGARDILFQARSFYDKPVNNLMVEGVGYGKKQIEIQEFTFDGIRGTLPLINLTNCDVIALRSQSFSPTPGNNNPGYKLFIDATDEIDIFPHAFNQTAFHGHFSNIKELNIQTNAFLNTPSSVIRITSSTIGRLSKLTNSLKSFDVSNSVINVIESETFDAFELTSIVFQNCTINTIESNAFTNRVSDYLFLEIF